MFQKLIVLVGLGILLVSTAKSGDIPCETPLLCKQTVCNPVHCFYVEVFGGVSFPPDLYWDGDEYEIDTGYNIGGAVGTSLNNCIDVEFEVFYNVFDYTGFTDSLDTLGLMFNAFYNIPLGNCLTGYVGGGLGALNVNYDTGNEGNISGDDWIFGYQFIGGVRYSLSECLDLFTEYRYSAGVDDASIGGIDMEYRSNDVSAGIRFKF